MSKINNFNEAMREHAKREENMTLKISRFKCLCHWLFRVCIL